MQLSKDTLRDMYLCMKRIRDFELSAKALFAGGRIPGFVHLYIGEEAVATGACACLRESDYITSTHRGHGHIVAKGGEPKYMMAELYGKETGYCKGKGGSMHIADAAKGILGANGIVGAGHNIAVGAGLSIMVRKTDQVCVCFFGDASTNQGTFHEALNLASIWKLPIIFVCENNGYGISMSQQRHMLISDIAIRANSYGIPGVVVDGNDVLAVFDAVTKATSEARAGNGPTLIECKTYRQCGHFEGDAGKYRKDGELASWLEKDPIPRFAAYLKENKLFTAQELEEFDKQVADEIAEAIAFAEESPYLPIEKVIEDVYTDIVEEVRVR